MGSRNKKSIEELEKEVAELIAGSGQCKQDILTDFNDYRALKRRSATPGSFLSDCDIRRMKELKNAFLLCQSIINKQKKIQAARKAAAATAASATLSNVLNTSVSFTAAAAD